MARPSKPWFWKKRQQWFCTIDGERFPLGVDRDEAHREFHKRMAALPALQPQAVGDQQLVVSLVDKFLTFVETNLAPDTYEWYRSRLQCWCEMYPDLTVVELKTVGGGAGC